MTTDTVEPLVAADYKTGVRGTDRPPGRGDLGMAMIFILPAAIGFLVFYLYPFFRGFYFSLTRYDLLGTPHFIGLDNFTKLFQDELFWNALLVTVEYVLINIVFQTVLALGIAVLMHRLTKSTVDPRRDLAAVADLQCHRGAGVVLAARLPDWACQRLHRDRVRQVAILRRCRVGIPTIAMVNVWRHMGYTALLVFAGLQTIPDVRLRGRLAGWRTEWQSFRRITLPLLRPVLALVLVITVTGSFQVFDTVAVTTKGGPGNASRVISTTSTSRLSGRATSATPAPSR